MNYDNVTDVLHPMIHASCALIPCNECRALKAAIHALETFEEHPSGPDSVTVSLYNFRILMAAYRAAPRPIAELSDMKYQCDHAFAKEMEGRQYGTEETRDAKAWFTAGYNATHPQAHQCAAACQYAIMNGTPEYSCAKDCMMDKVTGRNLT